jgi:hypothetical protein
MSRNDDGPSEQADDGHEPLVDRIGREGKGLERQGSEQRGTSRRSGEKQGGPLLAVEPDGHCADPVLASQSVDKMSQADLCGRHQPCRNPATTAVTHAVLTLTVIFVAAPIDISRPLL